MAASTENTGKFYNAANYGSIEKLTMLNYFSWKQSMTFHLNSLRVLDIVNGTRTPLPPNASRERREESEKEAALASSVIHGACSTGVHGYLTGIMDPHEMWIKLQTQFDSATSASSRETILFNLGTARPEHGEPITDFISRIIVLRERLVGSPEEVDDAKFIRYLLRALPAEYNILKEILFNLVLTVDQVIQRITNSAVAQGIIQPASANTSSVSSAALAAYGGTYRGANANRGRGGRRFAPFRNPLILATRQNPARRPEQRGSYASNMVCWDCGETGHGKSSCPVTHATPEQQAKGFAAYQEHQRARRGTSSYANVSYYEGAQQPPPAL
jgi:hypothetical protein